MSLESGSLPRQEMLNHCASWRSAKWAREARTLEHGLVIPPFALPDHINFDGGAVFYPGTYSSGDDQGNGAYGSCPR